MRPRRTKISYWLLVLWQLTIVAYSATGIERESRDVDALTLVGALTLPCIALLSRRPLGWWIALILDLPLAFLLYVLVNEGGGCAFDAEPCARLFEPAWPINCALLAWFVLLWMSRPMFRAR